MDHNYYIYIYICNSYDPLITSYQLFEHRPGNEMYNLNCCES